jgi:hypothetical protein
LALRSLRLFRGNACKPSFFRHEERGSVDTTWAVMAGLVPAIPFL